MDRADEYFGHAQIVTALGCGEVGEELLAECFHRNQRGCCLLRRMVEEFEDVVFNLGTNQVSDIFQTRFGYHIAKVYDRKPQAIPQLKDVEEQIVNDLKRQMADEAVDRFVDDLKSTAKIEDA